MNTDLSKSLSFFAVLGCILVAFTGCEKKPAAKPGPPDVVLGTVVTQDVPIYRDWIGQLNGSQNADIHARVTGYLTSQNYKEGSLVKSGDLLFQIDDRPFAAALAQAQADYSNSVATELKSRQDAERSAVLVKSGADSVQTYQNKTQTNLADKASVLAAQAAVDSAQINLNYTKVIAPFTGIAGTAQAQIGDLVGTAGGPALTTISQLDPVKLYFSISEQEYLANAKKLEELAATAADKRPDGIELILANGETYGSKGYFDYANRQVQANTGTIQIAGLFPNPGNLLRPGQYAKVRIKVDNMKNAVVVQQRAVAELQGTFSVLVVNSEDVAEVRTVKMGEKFESLWVVNEGLKPGEKVIVEGILKVRDGMKVHPVPGTKANGDAGKPEEKSSNPAAAPTPAEPAPTSTPTEEAALPTPAATAPPTPAGTVEPSPSPATAKPVTP